MAFVFLRLCHLPFRTAFVSEPCFAASAPSPAGITATPRLRPPARCPTAACTSEASAAHEAESASGTSPDEGAQASFPAAAPASGPPAVHLGGATPWCSASSAASPAAATPVQAGGCDVVRSRPSRAAAQRAGERARTSATLTGGLCRAAPAAPFGRHRPVAAGGDFPTVACVVPWPRNEAVAAAVGGASPRWPWDPARHVAYVRRRFGPGHCVGPGNVRQDRR